MIAGDQDYRRTGNRGAKSRQFAEREQDHRVRWSDLMKHVAGDENDVGRKRDDGIDRVPGGPCDIGLALVVSCRAQPLVLAEAEVEVGEVGDAHVTVSESRSGPRTAVEMYGAAARQPGGGALITSLLDLGPTKCLFGR